MSKYIEQEAVMRTARDGYHSDFGRSMADLTSLSEVLEDTPTADVVEVVRCKDCLYARKKYGNIECINGISYRNCWNQPDDYCRYGERADMRGDKR